MEKHSAPIIEGALRHGILKMPKAAYEASGIIVNGRRLKTFVFTTDLAIIRNCDADAVFAVYPFTPQQAISDAIIKASYMLNIGLLWRSKYGREQNDGSH